MSTAEPAPPRPSARSGGDPTAAAAESPLAETTITAAAGGAAADTAGGLEAVVGPRERANSPRRSAATSEDQQRAPGTLERIGELLDRLLVFDVFLVIGAALWFGAAVLLQARGVEAPLRLFQALWQPLFTPAIGLLMAAALLSGALGWWRRRGQR